jgi:hypothetical protein
MRQKNYQIRHIEKYLKLGKFSDLYLQQLSIPLCKLGAQTMQKLKVK